jgi:hypothetical protein
MNSILKNKTYQDELDDICNLWKHPATENERRDCPLHMDLLEQDAYIVGCRRIKYILDKVDQLERKKKLKILTNSGN